MITYTVTAHDRIAVLDHAEEYGLDDAHYAISRAIQSAVIEETNEIYLSPEYAALFDQIRTCAANA
jgi:hypothetical protein